MLGTLKRTAAGIGLNQEEFTLHGFRSTAITSWLRGGLDVRTVMALAGHSQMESTLRYLRPLEGSEEEDRARLDLNWRVIHGPKHRSTR